MPPFHRVALLDELDDRRRDVAAIALRLFLHLAPAREIVISTVRLVEDLGRGELEPDAVRVVKVDREESAAVIDRTENLDPMRVESRLPSLQFRYEPALKAK